MTPFVRSYADRFARTGLPHHLAIYAVVATREAHREAFVARAPLAANDGASFTNESFWTGVRAEAPASPAAPVPALPTPVPVPAAPALATVYAAQRAEMETEREAHQAAGALAARWERRLPAEPTREQRDAMWRLATRVAVRQSVPALCAADLGFVDFTVGAAVSL